ncbi:hypothetical protein HO173_006627 [Letharia columbiana]|uniref:Uncharacterized protein n=1 Tax=Letharia columbiana TaxID=112416 RepID=A0A8H6FVC8_9LECA|nr:uncharacterized protein HO173_006627 [Letharia columbiana]KAF6235431.1 hypothetical protein HO173_006627 [Letharia columbiana]
MEKMEIVATSLSVLLALVAPGSAQSTQSTTYYDIERITTTIFLPSALFSPSPTPQSFFAFVATSSGTTSYTLFEDENTSGNATINFLPAQQYEQYNDYGYTFSACPTGTQYVLPKQNLTINCLSVTPANTAICTTTSLNLDEASLPAYTTLAESSLYPATFQITNATALPPRLTLATKMGIGLAVPLGLCLCVVVALLIYRHREHKHISRMKHAAAVGQVPIAAETKDARFVLSGGDGGIAGVAASRDGGTGGIGGFVEGVGGGYGVRVSEVSAFTNELDGSGKDGRKELA